MHLFAMPSFVFGAARVLDLGSTFDVYNESLNGHIADQRAFLSDWQQVGMDISDSMEIFEHV
jgi:hypothetical protein